MKANAEKIPANQEEVFESSTMFGLFRKKTYTLRKLSRDIGNLRPLMSTYNTMWRNDNMEPAFREEIMVAVARVNDCRYCSFMHHEWALHVGLPAEELAQIEGIAPENFDTKKWLAIEYARTLATEDFGPISPELESRIQEAYAEEEIKEIETVAKVMTFGNLIGNTFEALFSRLRGKPADGSHVFDELVISSVMVIVYPLAMVLMGSWRGVSPLTVHREFQSFSKEWEAESSS